MSQEVNLPTQESSGRNPIVLVGGFVFLLALVLLLFGSNLFSEDAQPAADAVESPQHKPVTLPTGGDPLQVGDVPYEFALQDLRGNTFRLREFIGRPVLINFWATWCGPCRIEMPELQATFEEYKEDGLVILALDQDESVEDVRAFFYDEFGLTFTPLLDVESQVAEKYGTFGTLPTSYFINPDGEITAIHRGPMVGEQIESYLAQTIPDDAEGKR